MSSKPTYWDYIKVEELLKLQTGLSLESELTNDEVMFIVVHQIDELWFKLVLRELAVVRDLFARPVVPEQALADAARGIRRMEVLVKHTTHHFEVMETMTTRDYLGFRDKLTSASGFQSAQLREIEILLGLPDSERIPLGHEHSYLQALRGPGGQPSSASRRVEARLADRPTLADAIAEWLWRTPIQGSVPGNSDDDGKVRAFVRDYLASHERVTRVAIDARRTMALTPADHDRLERRLTSEIEGARAFLAAEDAPPEARAKRARVRAALVFIESYRELPLLAWPREIVDALLSFEQVFVIFRQRHARMVERVIGRRTGTGGSAGVDYLDDTALRYRVFRDLWAVRTLLLPATALPPLECPEFYGFAGDR